MKLSLLTLGCKTNQSESFSIQEKLQGKGYSIVGLSDKPELCIINTCSVTAKSDYESRQLIRKAYKSGARVLVTGCYSEINRVSVNAMEGVYKVIPNENKLEIPGLLPDKSSPHISKPVNAGKSRFFLKVQDGCDYSCSYCIIPKARGRSRSIKLEEILCQAEEAAASYNEIILTGIHLGTYGYDLNPKVSLSHLIKFMLLKTNIRRIRLGSLEITEVGDEMLELMKDERICKHLHIPLQSGDDKILKLMNRGYNSYIIQKRYEEIFTSLPDLAIGTDLIAGFPGEGDLEFENTRKLIDSLPFAYLHVFPFSARQGTLAASMPVNPDSTRKKDRVAVLMALGKTKKTVYMHLQNGKTLEAVIEKQLDENSYLGITGNYLKVAVKLKHYRRRSLVRVRITGCADDVLSGVPIDEA